MVSFLCDSSAVPFQGHWLNLRTGFLPACKMPPAGPGFTCPQIKMCGRTENFFSWLVSHKDSDDVFSVIPRKTPSNFTLLNYVHPGTWAPWPTEGHSLIDLGLGHWTNHCGISLWSCSPTLQAVMDHLDCGGVNTFMKIGLLWAWRKNRMLDGNKYCFLHSRGHWMYRHFLFFLWIPSTV